MKIDYDLHVHSCLSPCGDMDMTPANIAAMAMLKGLKLVALTDHNSCKNCPAFFAAAEQFGITPVAGMELTTTEDIHMVCLFPDLERAMTFDSVVAARSAGVKNRPDIFGQQLIMDEEDQPAGEVEELLIVATSISVAEAVELVTTLGGVAYPAHIDRESNGIIAVLGDIPADIPFGAVEFHDSARLEEYGQKYPVIRDMHLLCSSDAHRLEDISEAGNTLELPENTASAFIGYLLQKV